MKVRREDLAHKLTVKQRPEWREGGRHTTCVFGRRAFSEKGQQGQRP